LPLPDAALASACVSSADVSSACAASAALSALMKKYSSEEIRGILEDVEVCAQLFFHKNTSLLLTT